MSFWRQHPLNNLPADFDNPGFTFRQRVLKSASLTGHYHELMGLFLPRHLQAAAAVMSSDVLDADEIKIIDNSNLLHDPFRSMEPNHTMLILMNHDAAVRNNYILSLDTEIMLRNGSIIGSCHLNDSIIDSIMQGEYYLLPTFIDSLRDCDTFGELQGYARGMSQARTRMWTSQDVQKLVSLQAYQVSSETKQRFIWTENYARCCALLITGDIPALQQMLPGLLPEAVLIALALHNVYIPEVANMVFSQRVKEFIYSHLAYNLLSGEISISVTKAINRTLVARGEARRRAPYFLDKLMSLNLPFTAVAAQCQVLLPDRFVTDLGEEKPDTVFARIIASLLDRQYSFPTELPIGTHDIIYQRLRSDFLLHRCHNYSKLYASLRDNNKDDRNFVQSVAYMADQFDNTPQFLSLCRVVKDPITRYMLEDIKIWYRPQLVPITTPRSLEEVITLFSEPARFWNVEISNYSLLIEIWPRITGFLRMEHHVGVTIYTPTSDFIFTTISPLITIRYHAINDYYKLQMIEILRNLGVM